MLSMVPIRLHGVASQTGVKFDFLLWIFSKGISTSR